MFDARKLPGQRLQSQETAQADFCHNLLSLGYGCCSCGESFLVGEHSFFCLGRNVSQHPQFLKIVKSIFTTINWSSSMTVAFLLSFSSAFGAKDEFRQYPAFLKIAKSCALERTMPPPLSLHLLKDCPSHDFYRAAPLVLAEKVKGKVTPHKGLQIGTHTSRP